MSTKEEEIEGNKLLFGKCYNCGNYGRLGNFCDYCEDQGFVFENLDQNEGKKKRKSNRKGKLKRKTRRKIKI